MEVSATMIDKLTHLTSEQLFIFSALLDELSEPEKKDVSKRIGVAKHINFPADFDEIDYGTEEFFGLK